MPVRPLRPVDMVALASFGRRAGDTEITAHTWPVVEPESGAVPLWSLASTAFTQRVAAQPAWVAKDEDGLSGLVVARARAGALAWDVEHLFAPVDESGVATELLERVSAHAGSRAGRRVFVQMPEGSWAQDAARRAGFERYASADLHLLGPGFKVERTDVFEARPRLRSDEQGLFQLYNAAVPAPARTAEALTLEEWQGLHRGSRPWRPSIGGARQQLVWELGTTVVGWVEITFGQRSQFLQFIVHPRYEDATDRLLRYALLQVSPKAPVYVAAREYQPALGTALEYAGFRLIGRQDLYAKLLAARVKESRLVPANVVRA